MKAKLLLPISTAISIAVLGLALTSSNAQSQDMIVAKSPAQIEWFPTPVGAAGPLWGNMQATAYSRLSKWNPAASSPVHTHSLPYHAVILSGIFENVIADSGQVQEHAAGAYYYMPADVKHMTRCVSDEPCVMYLHQTGPWDLSVVP